MRLLLICKTAVAYIFLKVIDNILSNIKKFNEVLKVQRFLLSLIVMKNELCWILFIDNLFSWLEKYEKPVIRGVE